jgi:MFS family permease
MKGNKVLTKVAILTLCLTDCGAGGTTAALATIGAAFPTVPPAMIQMIASVPALFLGLVPILVYPTVVRFLKKRTILWIGSVLFLIGGLGPAWVHQNIYVILVFRAILGLAIGTLTPLGIDLCVDFFEGHEQRTMIGYTSVFVGISAIFFQTLGGFLSQINWVYTFYCYAPAAIFFLISIIFLPEPERRIATVADGAPKVKEKIPGANIMYAFVAFIAGILFSVCITNGAYVLVGDHIASPATIGVMFSALSVSTIIFGLIFGQLFNIFKFQLLWISSILGGVGLFLCGTTYSVAVFTAGLFLIGMLLGSFMACMYVKSTSLAPASLSSLAIGLILSGFNLGQFFQPVIFNVFSAPGRQPFMIGAVLSIVVAFVIILLNKAYSTKA